MSSFQERRQRRIERFKELAEKAHNESEQLHNEARKMASCIPFGQPILVGHHSEHRDRRFRDRIHNKFGKSVDIAKKAEYYAKRAKSAESNRAIFSDDPEAVQKLKEKLIHLEQGHEIMKAINKAWRALKKPKPNDTEAWEKIKQIPELKDFAKGAKWVDDLRVNMARDPLDRAPFTYQLQNNNGEISRVKKRIEFLQKQAQRETKEREINEVRILENTEENRLQIFFPDIPSEEIRKQLKSHGFRWSRTNKAWQRHLNDSAVYWAEIIVESMQQKRGES